MGRKKIKIRPIKDDRNRAVYLSIDVLTVGDLSETEKWVVQESV
jgi:hypothetical protein